MPEQPQNLDAMTQSSTSVLVTWQPPIDTFGDLEGYRLYYAKQNGLASREEELLVRGTSTVVEGLDPFTNYGFRVIAVNENGPGESTEATQAQTFSASEFLLVITLLHKKHHPSRFLHMQGSNIYTHVSMFVNPGLIGVISLKLCDSKPSQQGEQLLVRRRCTTPIWQIISCGELIPSHSL